MPQIFVGGTAPDYAGDSHTTIIGLLTKIRDTFVSSGWTVLNDSGIPTTFDFTVRNPLNTIFLRIFWINNELFIEGALDVTYAVKSSAYRCGLAVEGDDTRLYMNCQEHGVFISAWSNALNLQDVAFAGFPDVFYSSTLGQNSWWIFNCETTGWMYAESNDWIYDGSPWNSWNVAHSNETTNIELVGTYTFAGDGFIDVTVGYPYQLDADVDNDRNAGYFFYNGRENGLDGSFALAPTYLKFGRNDTNGDDGDYGRGDFVRGVAVNKQMFFTGYWTNLVRGMSSADQRTVVTDPNTGKVYVSGGGFKKLGFRIA